MLCGILLYHVILRHQVLYNLLNNCDFCKKKKNPINKLYIYIYNTYISHSISIVAGVGSRYTLQLQVQLIITPIKSVLSLSISHIEYSLYNMFSDS